MVEKKIVGECKQCGKCCICWIYDIPNQPAEIPPKKGWCPHLDLETSKCTIWDRRPEGCRNYPTIRDFEMGWILEECSYQLFVV